MIEFKDGTFVNIDESEPKIEFDLEETIAFTSNNSNIFIHKTSRILGNFIHVYTPKYKILYLDSGEIKCKK